ncbi:MAG: putative nucleotidyltransferase substrate binding domain-containing protein, partial [Bryobacteraceae bacterium]
YPHKTSSVGLVAPVLPRSVHPMKTAVIRQRVADFLKRHPPFDTVPEEDLVQLAGSGRVQFHESSEYVFRKGASRGSMVWVIQQGKVEILDDLPSGEQLRDMLGEGDLLGMGRFLRAPTFLHSARTASDVILYAIDGDAMEELVSRHPAMSRYLAVRLSVTARYGRAEDRNGAAARGLWESERRSWMDGPGPGMEFFRSRGMIVASGEQAGTVLERMSRERAVCAMVTGAGGFAVGLVRVGDVAAAVARGDTGVAIAQVSRGPVAAARPDEPVAGYWMRMMTSRAPVLAITADGAAASPLLGQLSAADLAIVCGRDPFGLQEAILGWTGADNLSMLIGRSRELVAETLTSPGSVDRGAALIAEYDRAACERLIAESEEELGAAGRPVAKVACWFGTGATGRGESLGEFAPELCGIAEDGSRQEEMDELADALGRRMGGQRPAILTRSEWRERFHELIGNPILNSIWENRTLLDQRPIHGDLAETKSLLKHVAAEVALEPNFVRILANDSLAQFPPLTFFRGLVIDMEGGEHQTFDLDTAAILPIIDSARVFGLSTGAEGTSNTVLRLEAAARVSPESAEILMDAAEAFRTVCWLRARLGGPVVEPATLTKIDQGLLSSAFAAIHELLALTASRFGFETAP